MPVEHYSAKEAGRIIGVDGQTWSETIRKDACAALVAAINYGAIITGNRVLFPKALVDKKAKEFGGVDG